MHRLLVLPATLLMCALLALLALFALAWNVLAWPLLVLLPRERGVAVGRWGIAYGYRLFWSIASASGLIRFDARALDALRDEPGLIIAANHPSLLDAPLLLARLPRSACIMKAALMRHPLAGGAARLARYIANDSPHGMVRQAVAMLRRGEQLVMFPEGTRTTEPPVNRFRAGVALIAKLAHAPVQAVFIDTDSPYLGKGWPPWRLPPLPICFTVRLGKRFAAPHDSELLLQQLEHYFAAGVRPPSRPAPAAGVAAVAHREPRSG